jgi:hypothetical protein
MSRPREAGQANTDGSEAEPFQRQRSPRFWAERHCLPGAEGDDAANGIVGGHTNGDTITRYYFDPEAPHPPAQLR